MAIKTKCLTPEANFSISIKPKNIKINIRLPESAPLTEKEAKLLEALLHNQVELALAYMYWK